ncbi:MAG: hypothetical protein AAFV53_21050 [Myxococcota bacterium]
MIGALMVGVALAQEPIQYRSPVDQRYLQVQAMAPDPTVALQMSALVGFGSGHFYAGSETTGAVSFGVQLVGLGTAAGGAAYLDRNPDQRDVGVGIVGAGLFMFAASRVVEMVTAPKQAHKTRAYQLWTGVPGATIPRDPIPQSQLKDIGEED